MGRIRSNHQNGYLGASLTAPSAGTSQTITGLFASAPDFATLASGDVVVLVLDTAEIVWLTAYTAGSLNGTITRGAEDATNFPVTTHNATTGTWAANPTAADSTLGGALSGSVDTAAIVPQYFAPGQNVTGRGAAADSAAVYSGAAYQTTVASGSNGVSLTTLNGGTALNVAAAIGGTGYYCDTSRKYLYVNTSGGLALLSYTGQTGTTYTGITVLVGIGSWTVSTGSVVSHATNPIPDVYMGASITRGCGSQMGTNDWPTLISNRENGSVGLINNPYAFVPCTLDESVFGTLQWNTYTGSGVSTVTTGSPIINDNAGAGGAYASSLLLTATAAAVGDNRKFRRVILFFQKQTNGDGITFSATLGFGARSSGVIDTNGSGLACWDSGDVGGLVYGSGFTATPSAGGTAHGLTGSGGAGVVLVGALYMQNAGTNGAIAINLAKGGTNTGDYATSFSTVTAPFITFLTSIGFTPRRIITGDPVGNDVIGGRNLGVTIATAPTVVTGTTLSVTATGTWTAGQQVYMTEISGGTWPTLNGPWTVLTGGSGSFTFVGPATVPTGTYVAGYVSGMLASVAQAQSNMQSVLSAAKAAFPLTEIVMYGLWTVGFVQQLGVGDTAWSTLWIPALRQAAIAAGVTFLNAYDRFGDMSSGPGLYPAGDPLGLTLDYGHLGNYLGLTYVSHSGRSGHAAMADFFFESLAYSTYRQAAGSLQTGVTGDGAFGVVLGGALFGQLFTAMGLSLNSNDTSPAAQLVAAVPTSVFPSGLYFGLGGSSVQDAVLSRNATSGSAGILDVGISSIPTSLRRPPIALTVTFSTPSNIATVPITSDSANFTNISATQMRITLTTTGALAGQTKIVRIWDYSATKQNLIWVNTEDSGVVAPTLLGSSGSTTIPRVVGFIFNAVTSKWTCVAAV